MLNVKSRLSLERSADPAVRESKYRRLERILRDRIRAGSYTEGALLPSELELANEFNLSRHSVRQSLQLLEQAGWISRQQGRGTLVFNPPRETSGNQSTRDVGVLIPCITIALYPGVARGIEDVIRSHGYHMVLTSYDVDPEREAKCLDELISKPVIGVIACPSYNSRPADYQRVLDAGVSLVLVDTMLEGVGADLVSTDDFWSAYEGAGALLRAGCRNIAYLTGHLTASTSRERLAGFRMAMEEAGVELPPPRISEGAFNADFGHSATQRLLEADPEVDGLFVANDPIAVGVARALREANRRLPICSFDEPAVTPEVARSIIHVKQCRYALGRAAGEALIRRIRERTSGQPAMPPCRIRIRAELNEPAQGTMGRIEPENAISRSMNRPNDEAKFGHKDRYVQI
jgi:GntR family transcriptional regulator of arabinose operon